MQLLQASSATGRRREAEDEREGLVERQQRLSLSRPSLRRSWTVLMTTALVCASAVYFLTSHQDVVAAPTAAPGTDWFAHSRVRVLDARGFDAMLSTARESDRLRKNFNFHSDQDALQAFTNAWICRPHGGECSYVQPHKHREPESLIVLRGSLAYLVFENRSSTWPSACFVLDAERQGPRGVFVEPGVYHSMAAFHSGRSSSPGEALVWEVKLKQPGEYTVAANKEWLPGSLPEENSGSGDLVREWMAKLCAK